MKAAWAGWFLCLAGALGAAASPAAEPGPLVQAGEDPSRQVLVLVNLPPRHFRADGNYAGAYSDLAGSAARRRLVQSLARARGLTVATEWPMPLLGVDCYVVQVPASEDAADVAGQLSRDPRIAWTQPMNSFRGLSDDPLYNLQPASRAWHLDELHATATGRDVRVAIVDSGVQLDHPDLRGQVVLSLDMVAEAPTGVAENHGTAVAGIVAAVAGNRIGIAGVAPHARLLALRACRQAPTETLCDTLGIARALQAAIGQGAQIINLSLSGPRDLLVQRLVAAALQRGISVVAAVDRSAGEASFPASIDGVIAVTDQVRQDAPRDRLAAPGADIPTTLPGSRWDLVSGASFATAHVSGLAALLLEKQAHRDLARPLTAQDFVRRDDGSIDACATLGRAAGACACTCDDAAALAYKTSH